MTTKKAAAKKAPAAKAKYDPEKLRSMTRYAPDPEACQHTMWTTLGNEPKGRVFCPQCRRNPKLREVVDAMIRNLFQEVLG